MKKFLTLSFSLLLFELLAYSQGCIIVRNISGFGQYNLTDNAFSTSPWQINITNRYFKSFRDYKGTEEQNTIPDSQNIVRSYSMDISVSRLFLKGWSLNFSLPINSNSRSSELEHAGKIGTPRYMTRSFGIGDIRMTVNKWLLEPSVRQKVNVQIGLGIKLPTGNYKYEDYFFRNDTTKVLAPVNPSIQLGDGGTGIITELNAFYIYNRTISFYTNFYYLINPREQNGVSTTVGRTPTSLQIKIGSVEASVPDHYSIRAGANFIFNRLAFSAGIRDEGIPVYDLIGGSNGFRRAGHNISVEPGIIYRFKKISIYGYVPVMVARKTKQTVPDKKESEILGKYTLRQGGFGNFLVFAGVQFKL